MLSAKWRNVVAITTGPMIEVKLIVLAIAPCNSPCAFSGVYRVIMACIAGKVILPSAPTTIPANIIQLALAAAKVR